MVKPSRAQTTSRFPGSITPKQRDRIAASLAQLGAQPITRLTGSILFILALVAIITGGFELRGATLTENLVGKPASRDYQAARDFVYVEKDFEATESLRERVAQRVPPVYDWHEDLGEQRRDQIHVTFDLARQQLAERLRAVTPRTLPSEPAPILPAPKPVSDEELIAQSSLGERVTLSGQFLPDLVKTQLDVPVSEQELTILSGTGFSPKVETALSGLVHEALSQLIVPNSRIIEDERDRGIYLRRLRQDKVLIEYHVTDLRGRLSGLEVAQLAMREEAELRLVEFNEPTRAMILALALKLLEPNTLYNEAITLTKRDRARQAVEDIVIKKELRKGQVIVERGEVITLRHVKMWEKMSQEDALFDIAQLVTGLVLLLLLVLTIVYQFGRDDIEQLRLPPKDIVFLGSTVLFFMILTKLGKALSYTLTDQLTQIPVEAWLYTIPVAGLGMLVRLVLRSEHAILLSLAFAIMAAMIMDYMLFYFVFTLLGCLIGAHFVRQVKHRLALMWSGLVVGMVNALMISTDLLLRGELFQADSVIILLMGFAGGLSSGFLVSAILPVFEASFGYTTDIKLLELANLNHPLLRELILRSPGSYHHSMMVGSLCEAAADQIGCNSLLARVGAYYHDIGKTKNPGYFAENQKYGDNPHDKLKPNMSALIIKAHVKDGVEMARQHGLPKEIVAFIEQHHGTSLIAYFYHKAKQLEDPDIPEVNEKDYRYPGPKPQSRETAICLLADGIEAASRAMPNKTPARLKGLVQNMINRAFTDGQLDECDLTLKDLNVIAAAFTRILTGIYHHRPEYPDAKKGGDKHAHKEQAEKARPSQRVKTLSAEHAAVSSQENADVHASSSSATSDTTKERNPTHEHRDSTPGGSEKAPREERSERKPQREKRASLPRLGPQ